MANKKIHILSILLAVLVVAGAAAVWTSSSAITKSADAVEFESIMRYGDPSAADGLKLQFKAIHEYEHRIIWNTAAQFGSSGPSFLSAHELFAEYVPYFMNDSVYSHDIQVFIDLDLNYKLRSYAEGLMSSAYAGESREIEINLSDYMEYLPLAIRAENLDTDSYFSIYTGGVDYYNGANYHAEENNWLTEHYRIPVPNETGTLRILKQSANSVSLTYKNAEGQYIDGMYGLSVIALGDAAGKDCIIYLYNGPYGEQIASGAAVYVIPVSIDGDFKLDTARYSIAAKNEEGFTTYGAGLTEDRSRLLAAADNGSVLKAYISDIKTGATQSVELCSIKEGQTYRVYFKDAFMVVDVLGDAYYCVCPDAGGRYTSLRFPQGSAFEQSEDFAKKHEGFTCTDVSFDGKKLALAGNQGELTKREYQGIIYRNFRYQGIYVSVYEAGGLKYHEEWTNGLKDSGGMLFGSMEQDPYFLSVSW